LRAGVLAVAGPRRDERQPVKARQHYLKVLEVEPRHPQAGAIRYWLAANPP